MKSFKTGLILLSIVSISYSQAPQAFNYQAILRNTDGTIKANETVVLQISIIQGHTDGPPVYLEVHNTSTSEFGMVNLVIGEGETSDDLSTIDWANGPYFLDIAVNDVKIGSSPLLSVPYALHANTADSITVTQSLAAILARNNDGGNSQIKNIAEPTDKQDAATKAYVDMNIPKGIIVMWHGDTIDIPEGWALCDGRNGTPNLSNRFILGYAANGSNAINQTGGAEKVTIGIDQMPSHGHGGATETTTLPIKSGGENPLNEVLAVHISRVSVAANVLAFQSHAHTINPEGGNQPHSNMPPYYVLAFIMKL